MKVRAPRAARAAPLLLAPLAVAACSPELQRADEPPPDAVVVETFGTVDGPPSTAELEQMRLDPSWRHAVEMDPVPPPTSPAQHERWGEITPERLGPGAVALPVGGDVEGPSALGIQVLLDRAVFSPGVIDGRWSKNTEKAVYWLQTREGLPATGWVDERTFGRLFDLAGRPERFTRTHRLSEEDVAGPFVELPRSIYRQADLGCMCYVSRAEKLGELFHASPGLLEQLNPGVNLETLTAGDTLVVPNIREPDTAPSRPIDHLVVSARGHYLHARDADSTIVYHFPSTLGEAYDPTPGGDVRIVSITYDPWWHFQPALLPDVPDGMPDAHIPPGPNSPVGVVWMALSKPHYGIHGAKVPDAIGTRTSAGCIRLTNWDALFLSRHVGPGTPVHFAVP